MTYRPKFPDGTVVYLTRKSCHAFHGLKEEEFLGIPMVVDTPKDAGSDGLQWCPENTTYVRPLDENHPWYRRDPDTIFPDEYLQHVDNDTIYIKEEKPLDDSINEAFI